MKTILLADDSITIQKVVELTFSEGDYRVVCASNGAQALRKIAEARPDVALIDVIMPEKNGYEVCEEIKRNPSTSGIPVLLLTGTFEPFDRKRAEAAGANGHLTKPFESQALVAKVEELIAARPHLAPPEASGRMEVISGGEVYRVEAGREGEGLKPAGRAGPPAAVPSPAAPTPPPPRALIEPAEPAPPALPASGSADAAAGGSYVGFADLGVGMEEIPDIVQDRYEEPRPAGPPHRTEDPGHAATVRIDREELFRGRDDLTADTFSPAPEETAGAGGADEAIELTDEPIEGFTGAFELPPEAAHGPPAAAAEPAWTPPPEAPPAETWQPEEETPAPGSRATAASPFATPPTPPRPIAAPDVAASPASLTPEAIDLIAEKVVERLSDRVVREIAWEVIPQVAEAIVRARIREIEGGEGG